MDKYTTVASLVLKEMVRKPQDSMWSLIGKTSGEKNISLTRQEKVWVRTIVHKSLDELDRLAELAEC